jgi:hypothetical protein
MVETIASDVPSSAVFLMASLRVIIVVSLS